MFWKPHELVIACGATWFNNNSLKCNSSIATLNVPDVNDDIADYDADNICISDNDMIFVRILLFSNDFIVLNISSGSIIDNADVINIYDISRDPWIGICDNELFATHNAFRNDKQLLN